MPSLIIRRLASPIFTALTNLYHSYGLVAGIGSCLALLVALLLKSTSFKDKRSVSSVCSLVFLTMGIP